MINGSGDCLLFSSSQQDHFSQTHACKWIRVFVPMTELSSFLYVGSILHICTAMNGLIVFSKWSNKFKRFPLTHIVCVRFSQLN